MTDKLMKERLKEEAYKLAMLVLQSDFYAAPEVKETVDNILALHGNEEQPIQEGSWPADDRRRAFVSGAKWWEFYKSGGTMWPSDRDLAEKEAERRYPGGKGREELPPRLVRSA